MDNMLDDLRTLQSIDVSLTINGKPWSGPVPAEEVLLDFLRERIGLTGTKRSCESQVCGACTVLVDGQPTSSCTIEGLASGEHLDPLQTAFIRNVGAQCGYCTPGQLMAAKALLLQNPSPTFDQIAQWMKGNICRCGCYPAIAQSILEAAEEGEKIRR